MLALGRCALSSAMPHNVFRYSMVCGYFIWLKARCVRRKRWRAIPFVGSLPGRNRLDPQPLIRSSPANRFQPTQLLVPQPRLPGSLPSLNRFIATWLPSSFLPGPTTRPESLLAGWIIPLPNPLPPRELGWPSAPCDRHCWLPRCSAPFLESRLACAFRYSDSLHYGNIAGQGVFFKSQGYPQTFLTIPRSFSAVHLLHTGFAQRSR